MFSHYWKKKITPVNKQRCSTSFLPFGLLGILFFLIIVHEPGSVCCILCNNANDYIYSHCISTERRERENEKQLICADLLEQTVMCVYKRSLRVCGRADVPCLSCGLERKGLNTGTVSVYTKCLPLHRGLLFSCYAVQIRIAYS